MGINTQANVRSRLRRAAALALALVALGTQRVSAKEDYAGRFSFMVLGHVRGDDNGKASPLLAELLIEVRKHAPDLIFLTGDMIWGDVHTVAPDAEVIKRDWARLDTALDQLGVPAYRVPGNHDISDPVTRDIYFARYGALPKAFTFRGSRFILINSAWVPEGSDPPPLRRPYVRGRQLDADQIEFIRTELSPHQRYEHVFLFMHHLLWWHQEEASWWRSVHPLLVGHNVRAVFGGDYGPMKFSHMRRDGIDYIQSSLEGDMRSEDAIKILRALESSRLLSMQFDNYLYVTVDGPQVTIAVKTIGEFSMGKFTPQHWRTVNEYQPPNMPMMMRVWDVIGSPRRLMALTALILVSLLSGLVAGLIWGPYRRS